MLQMETPRCAVAPRQGLVRGRDKLVLSNPTVPSPALSDTKFSPTRLQETIFGMDVSLIGVVKRCKPSHFHLRSHEVDGIWIN